MFHVLKMSRKLSNFIFPLNNAPSKLCACAHIGRETKAQKKKRGAHINVPSKNVFAHIRRSKYRRVLVKCCTKELLCAHRLKQIRGNIVPEMAMTTISASFPPWDARPCK